MEKSLLLGGIHSSRRMEMMSASTHALFERDRAFAAVLVIIPEINRVLGADRSPPPAAQILSMYWQEELLRAERNLVVVNRPFNRYKWKILRDVVGLHLDPPHLSGRFLDPHAPAISGLQRLATHIRKPVGIA